MIAASRSLKETGSRSRVVPGADIEREKKWKPKDPSSLPAMAIFLENAALKLNRKSLKKLSEFQTRNGSYGFSPRCFRVWISSSLEDLNLRSQLPSSHTNELLCSSWRNVRKIWITCYNDPLHSRNHNITTESSASLYNQQVLDEKRTCCIRASFHGWKNQYCFSAQMEPYWTILVGMMAVGS